MKVSDIILKPSIIAQIEGKANLALKEFQKEKNQIESKNNENNYINNNIAVNINHIDLLV